jgi:hypothetical protein
LIARGLGLDRRSKFKRTDNLRRWRLGRACASCEKETGEHSHCVRAIHFQYPGTRELPAGIATILEKTANSYCFSVSV